MKDRDTLSRHRGDASIRRDTVSNISLSCPSSVWFFKNSNTFDVRLLDMQPWLFMNTGSSARIIGIL